MGSRIVRRVWKAGIGRERACAVMCSQLVIGTWLVGCNYCKRVRVAKSGVYIAMPTRARMTWDGVTVSSREKSTSQQTHQRVEDQQQPHVCGHVEVERAVV